MKFNKINALLLATNIISSINDVTFHSHTLIFGKVYPDYFHALLKKRVVKNVRFFEDFSHVAQNLCNFAHVSVFKNIAPFAFYSVLKVMTFLT